MMDESVHKMVSLVSWLSAAVAFLYNLASNKAAQSSSFGSDNFFNGATFEVKHNSSQVVWLSQPVERK
jgi:hypothetical protein